MKKIATKKQQQAENPVQFRLPKPGLTDPWWSQNRSGWNTLVLPNESNQYNPPVKSIVLKQPNKKRGVRFIIFDSAKAYFDKLRAEQLGEAA